MIGLTDEQVISIVDTSHSWIEVANRCNLKTVTRSLQRRVRKLGLNVEHFDQHFDGLYTKFNRFTKEFIESIVKTNTTWEAVMTALGYKSCQNVPFIKRKLDKLSVDYSHIDPTYIRSTQGIPLSDILVKDSTYTGMPQLRLRLKRELGWEHKCSVCLLTEWNGIEIPIQIDHINGDHWDHRITNIRFICPNCHAQTDTYCGKNTRTCKQNAKKVPNQPVNKKGKKTYHCVDCNVQVKNHKVKRCNDCNAKYQVSLRKTERPSYAQLKEDLAKMAVVNVGKKYGVSDNCIRKWVRLYEKHST